MSAARALILITVFVGCDDGGGGDPPIVDVGVTEDMAGEGGGGEETDQGPVDAAPLGDAAEADAALPDAAPPEPPAELCPDGLSFTRPFAEGSGLGFGDRAGDFALETLDGPWRLSEQWTGCENYVFLVYIPDLRQRPGPGWPGDQLWDSDPLPLLQLGADNTHYIFLSFEDDVDARARRMRGIRGRLSQGLEDWDRYAPRVHFAIDRLTEVDGSVGDFAVDYLEYLFDPTSVVDLGDRGRAQPPLPFVFGIDRQQRWDSGGSMAEVVGRPMIWRMAAYLGAFYNHLAHMDHRVTTEAAEVVPLVEGRVSARIHTQTVELPDAAVLAGMDTLELDVRVFCPHRNVFGCSEWDRIAHVEWCADAECADRTEIARWITPYWRRGERRWLIDASPFLSLVQGGGAQTFRVVMGPEWERATERDVLVALRFRQQGGQPAPLGIARAFTGGDFGAEYNEREPFVFTPPVEATRVELVTLVSGHGQTAGDNCAEWCDHRHAFTINGAPIPVVRHLGPIGTLDGCARKAGEGVSPGQFGNWAPGRAFWCPGLPVEAFRQDLTEHVELGQENSLTYQGFFGADRAPRGGNIALSVYVAWYTD